MRICANCGLEKEDLDFRVKKAKDRYSMRSICSTCRAKYNSRHYFKNKNRIVALRTARDEEVPRRAWVWETRRCHKNKGYAIAISFDRLLEIANSADFCPLCGIKFTWRNPNEKNSVRRDRPTLDRINNEDILTEHNVMIVCAKCNGTKQDRTFEEFLEYCRMIAAKFPPKI